MLTIDTLRKKSINGTWYADLTRQFYREFMLQYLQYVQTSYRCLMQYCYNCYYGL